MSAGRLYDKIGDDELIIDVAKRYKISVPAELAYEYEEELCPDADAPISWSRFYDVFIIGNRNIQKPDCKQSQTLVMMMKSWKWRWNCSGMMNMRQNKSMAC